MAVIRCRTSNLYGHGGAGEERAISNFNLLTESPQLPEPGPKGRLIGQKPPLKPREVWAIRVRLQVEGKRRDQALFNLAIDSKLRSCDLVALRVSDVVTGGSVRERAVIIQQKTSRPVQFELTEPTRDTVAAWISHRSLDDKGYCFPAGFIVACTSRRDSTPGS